MHYVLNQRVLLGIQEQLEITVPTAVTHTSCQMQLARRLQPFSFGCSLCHGLTKLSPLVVKLLPRTLLGITSLKQAVTTANVQSSLRETGLQAECTLHLYSVPVKFQVKSKVPVFIKGPWFVLFLHHVCSFKGLHKRASNMLSDPLLFCTYNIFVLNYQTEVSCLPKSVFESVPHIPLEGVHSSWC